MGHNVEAAARIVGDLKLSLAEFNKKLKGKVNCSEWYNKLNNISKKNKELNIKLMSDPVVPMTYYSSY